MTDSRVRRVQELRRSNAAQPRPGKRREDEIFDEDYWAQFEPRSTEGLCGLCGDECEPCSRGECDIYTCTCMCS